MVIVPRCSDRCEMTRGTRALAEEISRHCRDAIGGGVRSVVHYSSHDHDPLYTREDVEEELGMDVDTRTMFRNPLVQVNKTIWQVSRLAPTLPDPDFATFSYGDTVLLLFPITADEGIVVSLDYDGTLPDDLVAGCTELVHDWVGSSF